MKDSKSWYRIENKDSGPAHVYLYDYLGFFGVEPADFVRELGAVKSSEIILHLDSPGGVATHGITIYNALREHPAKVEVHVDGYAASAATIVAMAGDKILMNRGTHMMIHDGQLAYEGDAAGFREAAEALDSMSDSIASIYAARAGQDASYWRNQMRKTTRYNAQEAVDAGLADGLVDIEESGARNQSASPFMAWDGTIPDHVASPVVRTKEETPVTAFDPAIFRKILKGEIE